LKISQYLANIWRKLCGLLFCGHPVYQRRGPDKRWNKYDRRQTCVSSYSTSYRRQRIVRWNWCGMLQHDWFPLMVEALSVADIR